MDTKWKNTDTGLSLPEVEPSAPAEGRRPGRARAVCGFLAFVLGVSLLLTGGVYFAAELTSSNSRQWIADSFQADWRDSSQFRDYICSRLELLIKMGAGRIVSSGGYYRVDPQKIHDAIKEDKNLLYCVEKEGEELYNNSTRVLPSETPARLMERSYGFLLKFDGEKVRIWQDGVELTVYDSDYYSYGRESGYQWYVPGYKNFTVDEEGSKVQVTMAVLTAPQVFIKGSYGASGTEQYNELYYLKQNLDSHRLNIVTYLARLGAGAGLLLLYVLLRKDKARADRFLARGTGRVWFEIKLVLVVVLLWGLLPHGEEFGQVWREITYFYNTQTPIASTAELDPEYWMHWGIAQAEAEVGPITVVQALTENTGWLLRAWLEELSASPTALLLGVWGLYLLLINDWRYNKKPWRHGVTGLLCAWGLRLPIQQRLSRASGLTALALLLLGGANIGLLIYACSYGWGRVRLEHVWLIGGPVAVLLVVSAANLLRQRLLWEDLGAVAQQAQSIRAGDLEHQLKLPDGHDLHQLADDLSHIQQGLHQAVDERTRSERMKVELVTNVSHDLKTPLTSIISYTELLEQEHLEPPAGEYVTILGEKARRLKTMVQDVFEVSKAASGQLPVKLERLDFARLLRQTLADMDAAISDSGLTLRVKLPEGEVPIVADSDRMYRVFQNLIGNALKYSLAGSRVYVELAVDQRTATATVRNTSATELDPEADYAGRFVRGDASRTDGGSGLGLSIADSFTAACGGRLEVLIQADLFTVRVSFPVPESR